MGGVLIVAENIIIPCAESVHGLSPDSRATICVMAVIPHGMYIPALPLAFVCLKNGCFRTSLHLCLFVCRGGGRIQYAMAFSKYFRMF